MVKMIMKLVRNRSFTLTTGDSKQSRLRRLKNGVPQGSVLDPLLFNIYTYNLPSMISRKFAYADYLALLHFSGKWKDLEGTLSQDMSTLSAYLQTWRLKLCHTKTVMAAFHLNNREAKRKLKVYNNGRLLPFCPTPTYLGVKLDRSLTFRDHLLALRKKLSSSIQPAELRQMGATLSLAHCRSLDRDHILYGLLSGSSNTRQVRLISRCPFVPAARNLLDNFAGLGMALLSGQITNGMRSTVKTLPGSVLLSPGPVPGLLGWACPEQLGLRTGVGQLHSSMHKWGLAPLPNCKCGAAEQTADHFLIAFSIHRKPPGSQGLTILDDETRCWLNNITASI